MVRINPVVDPARCLSCAQGRHLNCTGQKDRKTECVCTYCLGHERSTTCPKTESLAGTSRSSRR